MNAKQIKEIARQSKACAKNGLGIQVVIFEDGSCLQATGSQDCTGRGDGNGGWLYPVLRISTPCTAKQIAEELG